MGLSHNFSGSAPHCLGIMAELLVLNLRKNNFSGSLLSLCSQSTSLMTTVLNGNQFKGSTLCHCSIGMVEKSLMWGIII